MSVGDILIIVTIVIAAIVGGIYYFNKKKMGQYMENENLIQSNKVTTSIYVIDKKFTKPTPENLPKAVYESLPKTSRMRKMAIVKAKVGPQITTLICDKNVFDALTVKKTVKCEVAGLYIVSVVGLDLSKKKKKTIGEKIRVYAEKGKDSLKKQ